MEQGQPTPPLTTSFVTRFSYDFFRHVLPPHAVRLLEIGCGTGELAARLMRDGLIVTAIDHDGDSVAAARALGVDARLAEWPGFEQGEFDAVLFTRSLHHIAPLREALEQAFNCLSEGGRIIVEDFALEAVDERSLRWFVNEGRALHASGLFVEDNEFLNDLLASERPLEAWRTHVDAELHLAAAIEAELQAVTGDVVTETAPYYFRYFATALRMATQRDAIAEELARKETFLIADGAITALGRRFVAPREKISHASQE